MRCVECGNDVNEYGTGSVGYALLWMGVLGFLFGYVHAMYLFNSVV